MTTAPGVRYRVRANQERASLKTNRYLGSWLQALRVHQWLKNLLVLVPALLGHRLAEPRVLLDSLIAFLAFSLCASSAYIVNDLRDVRADQAHPRKRNRPFASGALARRHGLVAALMLLAAALALGARSPALCGFLALYFVTSVGYSVWFKRVAGLDVLTLAGLYTLRLLAGGVAAGVEPSFWLLAFSMFLFLSLAMVKRATELAGVPLADGAVMPGRGYGPADAALLVSLGSSAGYVAVLVLALYINSPESQMMYRHARLLWLVCPLLLYWITRVWLLTARGQMRDDPVVFAITDPVSLLVTAGVLAFGVCATL